MRFLYLLCGGLLAWLLLAPVASPALPLPMRRLPATGQLAAGYSHTLLVRPDGTIYAWGFNNFGQLGTGGTTTSSTPVAVSKGAAPVGTRFVQAAAGSLHSLALTADGTIYAWGYNQYGQLGNNSLNANSTPVAVSRGAATVGTRFVQVAAGLYHSLALAADGTLYTWGANDYGQLGNGTTTTSLAPVAVSLGAAPAGTRFVQVAAGYKHSLALAADGTLYTWGSNVQGELGNGTTTDSHTPIAVSYGSMPAGTRFSQIACGDYHSLALAADGTLYGWGDNQRGQLGNNVFTNTRPAAVSQGGIPAGTRFSQIACGNYHSLALAANGTLYAWGDNNYGELGNSSYATGWLPVAVSQGAAPAGTRFGQLAGGAQHSLALAADGTLYAWGANDYGQLGNNTTSTALAPVAALVPATTGYVQATGGIAHTLGLRADGSLYAWGWNNTGQLGNNSTTYSSVPVAVGQGAAPAGTRFGQVSAGYQHSLALATDGSLYAWGFNSTGQLGTNSTTDSRVPVAVSQGEAPAGTRFVQVAASYNYSVALAADGSLYAWGANSGGQLGNNSTTQSNVPVAVSQGAAPAGTRFVQVAAGYAHALALAADGSLYAWGANGQGELGNNSTTQSNVPVAVSLGAAPAGTRFVQVSAGAYHMLALAADGTIYTWGYNSTGQLGINSTTDSHMPVAVSLGVAPAGTRFVQVAAGVKYAMALAADGKVYTWGYNYFGQLGINSTTDSPVPVAEYSGLTGWRGLAAGPTASHSLVLGAGGAVFAAGNNSFGQLGDGTITDSPVFIRTLAGAPLPVRAGAPGSSGLALYPNPVAGGRTQLLGAQPGTPVQVLDGLGRLVLTTHADSTGAVLLTLPTGLAPGLYLVRTGPQALRLHLE